MEGWKREVSQYFCIIFIYCFCFLGVGNRIKSKFFKKKNEQGFNNCFFSLFTRARSAYMTTDDAKLLNTNDDKLCRKTPKRIFRSFHSIFHLDNLEITRISAPFSSRNLWLSFFRCSNCCKDKQISVFLEQ